MTGINFGISDDAYANLIQATRAYALEMSKRILAGDQLEALDRKNVAEMLRAYADAMSESRPRRRGQGPKIDPGSVAMCFAMLRTHEKMSANEAHELLAERFEVSVTAIKKALTKYGPEAIRLTEGTTALRGRKPIR